MSSNIVPLTKKAVKPIIKNVAPDLIGFASQITDCISEVTIKSKELLQKQIEMIGIGMEEAGKIAEKLCDVSVLAEQADCQDTSKLVDAVLNDEATSMTEKVKLIQNYKNSRNIVKGSFLLAGTAAVLVAGCFVANKYLGIKAVKARGFLANVIYAIKS